MLTELALGVLSQFMPPNDLHLQDNLYAEEGITEDSFTRIIQAGREAYEPLAAINGERLVIHALWSNPTVNANCCRGCKQNEVTVNMFGGLARRKEVGETGFAIVLCHELSHAYGGTPYIDAIYKMSAEGQSDYMATKECMSEIYKRVPELQERQAKYAPFIEKNCSEENLLCRNSLVGAKNLSNLLAFYTEDKLPEYETPDQTVVTRTEVSYPKTVQCRLDTMVAGVFAISRPKCWYKGVGARPSW